jgi:hypothetical protein
MQDRIADQAFLDPSWLMVFTGALSETTVWTETNLRCPPKFDGLKFGKQLIKHKLEVVDFKMCDGFKAVHSN